MPPALTALILPRSDLSFARNLSRLRSAPQWNTTVRDGACDSVVSPPAITETSRPEPEPRAALGPNASSNRASTRNFRWASGRPSFADRAAAPGRLRARGRATLQKRTGAPRLARARAGGGHQDRAAGSACSAVPECPPARAQAPHRDRPPLPRCRSWLRTVPGCRIRTRSREDGLGPRRRLSPEIRTRPASAPEATAPASTRISLERRERNHRG